MIGQTLTRLKRLEQLEQVRRAEIAAEGPSAHERLIRELNRIRERMRGSADLPPERQLTAEEVQRGVEEWFALRRERCRAEP